jgi:menaquinol-cytochrome c reductase cytochrome b/c subunit
MSTLSRVLLPGKPVGSSLRRGSEVFASDGCFACHRIGDDGNSGPGPDLTSVARELSAGEIEKRIVSASAPMPSFGNIPNSQLMALVRFLSALRGQPIS